MRIFFQLLLSLITAVSLLETAVANDSRVLAGHAFDGQPISLNGVGLKEAPSGLETEIVAIIMRHAGLPQNFVLYTTSKVANVAAVIVADKDGRGKRALFCNEKFMRTAQQASREGNWAPVSIIAHEIGHHIEGQTLAAGDWQASGELAADAFSGFILYKLGAKLSEASRAVNTLVRKRDTPSRDARLLAVRQGWMLACRQQSDHCEGNETALLLPARTTIDVGAPTDKPGTPTAPALLSPVTNSHVDILPLPDRQDIPVKFGKFVVDELGVLDRAARASFEQRMFEIAAKNHVEIVTIVSKDLHGLTADEYAQAMLRQLAVGSQEVANGAVLLVAPQEKQVGMALAPGLLTALGDKAVIAREQLKNFKEFSLIACEENCRAEQTAMLFHASAFIADMIGEKDFSVLYPKDGWPAEGDASTSAICLRGKVLGHDTPSQTIPPVASVKDGQITLKIIGGTGLEALLSLDPDVEKLAQAPLATGQNYQFITREMASCGGMRRFEVLSYAALP
jgi:hypothetical protein